jgi:hypothetical protein
VAVASGAGCEPPVLDHYEKRRSTMSEPTQRDESLDHQLTRSADKDEEEFLPPAADPEFDDEVAQAERDEQP